MKMVDGLVPIPHRLLVVCPWQAREDLSSSSSNSFEVSAKTKKFVHACKILDLDPKEASKALHDAKAHAYLSGGDDCTFDLDNGDIHFNDEWIGNLHG